MEGVTITEGATQALVEYRQAFIRWAVAAYAYGIAPGHHTERRKYLGEAVERAIAHRDDCQIALLSELFPNPLEKEQSDL